VSARTGTAPETPIAPSRSAHGSRGCPTRWDAVAEIRGRAGRGGDLRPDRQLPSQRAQTTNVISLEPSANRFTKVEPSTRVPTMPLAPADSEDAIVVVESRWA
jgi:hypothetical protein